MSRTACTRVACLRLPWFLIDALEHAGHIKKDAPVAVTQGLGAQATIRHTNPLARTMGVHMGMRVSRARTVVSGLHLIPWDSDADALFTTATEALNALLASLSPRFTLIGPGCWWLEPFWPRSPAKSLRAMESTFGHHTLTSVTSEGYGGPRLGIADGPVAAHAATHIGGTPLRWVAPGEDHRFLRDLPISALPLDARTLGLLDDLGLRTAGELQVMGAPALEARFGAAGRRAWQHACGHDPRRPETPRPQAITRIVVPLLDACAMSEPLLFVLRPAVEQLIAAHAERAQSIDTISLTLEGDRGATHEVLLTPSHPTSDPRLLLELLRLRLEESLPSASQDPVVRLILEAQRVTPRTPRQPDLFTHALKETLAAESTLVRLSARLPGDAITTPRLCDDHRPESTGRWTGIHLPSPASPPELSPPSDRLGCLRLLPSPRQLKSDHRTRPTHVPFARRILHPTGWHGPERLSGHWWSARYARDYYWVTTREGWALWLFLDGHTGHWFLHGWLD